MGNRATLHVIHEGAIDGDHVSSTVSLILDGDARLVVDPGMVPNRRVIVDALARLGVQPEAVTHVLLTHHHPDHTLNAALFPNADVVDAWAIYRGDLWLDHDGDGFRPTPHVRLLVTPGHSAQDVTWLVETDDGVMACTHAWGLADSRPEDDGYATDQQALAQSRQRILEAADVVVPGHDGPFPTRRNTHDG
jgi:glyoxylase-like metal-dependent hydrolase (beta-lactamase superfamily II)